MFTDTQIAKSALHWQPWPNPLWRGLLGGAAAVLLVDSVYLACVRVTHLGVVLPACMGLLVLGLAVYGAAWLRWVGQRAWRQQLWRWAWRGVALWGLSVLAFFVWLHGAGTALPPAQAPKALVVLGASAHQGKPSPTLAQRLLVAYQWAQRYPDARVVVSGGVDFRQTISEAQAMAQYLQDLGLAPERIVREDRSTSTFENLLFSARVLQAVGVAQTEPVLVVTSDFHTLRAQKIAARVGWVQVHTVGAPTPLYMRYNAWLREYFAYLSGWLLREF